MEEVYSVVSEEKAPRGFEEMSQSPPGNWSPINNKDWRLRHFCRCHALPRT
jgi:hypothetical protein